MVLGNCDARRTPTPPELPYPRWQGERLAGKSIVIWTEFGLGDEIMFSRFAADLKDTLGAARVSVLCQDPIYPLLRDGLAGADLILPVSRRDELPHHDYWVFPHSIPLYRTLTTDSVPAAPYLGVPEAARAQWAERLALGAHPCKVGLVWQGSPTHENDAHRSIHDLAQLDPILALPDIAFVSLQKGRAETDAIQWAEAAPEYRRALGHQLDTMSDTAAVVAGLDLVIAVDTSVAHLAGAMGKPVWLMLPTMSDWRWLFAREDSVWYPSMRVFRQQRLGQWEPVVARMATELARLSRALAGQPWDSKARPASVASA
ncbi:glycosyltransferase family 9 protein [Cupriavidus necator]